MKNIFLFFCLLTYNWSPAQNLNWIIPPEMDEFYFFDNWPHFIKGNQAGFMNPNLKWVFPMDAYHLKTYYPYFILQQRNKHNIYSILNDSVAHLWGTYDEIRLPEFGRYMPARKGKLWGFLHLRKPDYWAIAPQYETVGDFMRDLKTDESSALVKLNGQTVRIDTSGNILPPSKLTLTLESPKMSYPHAARPNYSRLFPKLATLYRTFEPNNDPPNYYIVTNHENLKGIVRWDGTILAPAEYNGFSRTDSNYIIGYKSDPKLGNSTSLWNLRTGKRLDTPYSIWVTGDHCQNILFKDKETVGILDTNGQILVAPIFQQIEALKGGYWLTKNENRKLGILNCEGKEIFPPIFEDIKWFNFSCFGAQYQGKWGLLETPK